MNNPQYSFCFTLFIILVISRGLTDASVKVEKNTEDSEDVTYEGKDLEIPGDLETTETKKNISCVRRSNSHMHEIQKASHIQFPYMVALMSSSYEYVCAGSMVANGMILTSADCVESTTYALINTTSVKKDSASSVFNVLKTNTFPTNDKRIALLYTKKLNNSMVSTITISNITRAEEIVDVEAIGFGLNAEVGHVKELQYVGLEVGELQYKTKAFLSCIDTNVPSCFRDKGGPLLVNNQLVGVILSGQDECTAKMTSKYDLSKPMVDFIHAFAFKAWLNEMISKNKDDVDSLDSLRTGLREAKHMLTSRADTNEMPLSAFLVYIFFNVL